MPRINTVKKARKDQGTCGCGTEVKRGDSYKWIEFRYGGRRIKCASCHFRPSELTQSKMSTVYAAQESIQDYLDSWDGDLDDLKGEIESAIDEIRDVATEYQDAADAIRDAVADSPAADDNEEKANELESWISDLEQLDPDAFHGQRNDDDEPLDQEAFQEWKDNITAEVLSAFDDCPL